MTQRTLREIVAVLLLLSIATVVRSSDKETDTSRRIRVLSYNIHHGEGIDRKLDLERIARVILSVKPDLVALQEVDRNTDRTNKIDQPAELARLTKMHVAFGGNIEFQGGQYGNAVLSKSPIRRHKNHVLPNLDDGEQRGVLEVEVEFAKGLPIVLFATHLDHRAKDRERIASARTIN
jgi:endonuclease/exonuclease/phosphatase family metal-dependent hydrolase